jgi:hypothetical protein
MQPINDNRLVRLEPGDPEAASKGKPLATTLTVAMNATKKRIPICASNRPSR